MKKPKLGPLVSSKRDGTAALGDTVETIPSLANSAVTIAGSAVGAGNLVSGATGTAENAVAGSAAAVNSTTLLAALPEVPCPLAHEAKAGNPRLLVQPRSVGLMTLLVTHSRKRRSRYYPGQAGGSWCPQARCWNCRTW